MLCTSLESGGGALCLCQDNESRQESIWTRSTLADGTLAFPAYSCGLSLSVLLHPYPLSAHPHLPALSRSWSAVWWGMWMDARTNGWIPCSLSLVSNLRTQLPGETTMTPPPHTQPAHRGPPVGDTLHRAATTAASKVSATQKLAPTVHKHTHTHRNTPYIFAFKRECINARACGRRSMQNILIILDE